MVIRISRAIRIKVHSTDGDGLMTAMLDYSSEDPFAVRITFYDRTDTTWLFAREVMRLGLYNPSGEGDYRITPGENTINIRLSAPMPGGYPDHVAYIATPRAAIESFLNESYDAVPMGTEMEHCDIDAEIANLLRA